MIGVLFVCMGNICRSPMAEAIFQTQVARANLNDHFVIDSAGTTGYHAGEAAHLGTRSILKHYHITYAGRSRQIVADDLAKFDYLICMDIDNSEYVQMLDSTQQAQNKIYRLLEFAQHTTLRDVPDPYFSNNFDYVYQLIFDGCQGLLNFIRREHNL